MGQEWSRSKTEPQSLVVIESIYLSDLSVDCLVNLCYYSFAVAGDPIRFRCRTLEYLQGPH